MLGIFLHPITSILLWIHLAIFSCRTGCSSNSFAVTCLDISPISLSVFTCSHEFLIGTFAGALKYARLMLFAGFVSYLFLITQFSSNSIWGLFVSGYLVILILRWKFVCDKIAGVRKFFRNYLKTIVHLVCHIPKLDILDCFVSSCHLSVWFSLLAGTHQAQTHLYAVQCIRIYTLLLIEARDFEEYFTTVQTPLRWIRLLSWIEN